MACVAASKSVTGPHGDCEASVPKAPLSHDPLARLLWFPSSQKSSLGTPVGPRGLGSAPHPGPAESVTSPGQGGGDSKGLTSSGPVPLGWGSAFRSGEGLTLDPTREMNSQVRLALCSLAEGRAWSGAVGRPLATYTCPRETLGPRSPAPRSRSRKAGGPWLAGAAPRHPARLLRSPRGTATLPPLGLSPKVMSRQAKQTTPSHKGSLGQRC